MIVQDPSQQIRYVLKNERKLPSEEQSVFLIRVLKATEQAKLEDQMTSVNINTNIMSVGKLTMELKALMIGLAGWENVKDKDGNEVEFMVDGRGKAKSENFDYLPQWARTELANAITEGNKITPEDEKN